MPQMGSAPNRTLPKFLGKYGSIALLVQNPILKDDYRPLKLVLPNDNL